MFIFKAKEIFLPKVTENLMQEKISETLHFVLIDAQLHEKYSKVERKSHLFLNAKKPTKTKMT